jgi:hypothetical protein
VLRGRPVGQYWLHVKASGEELWLDHQPTRLKCLRVEVIDLGRGRTVEQTKSWCREEYDVYHEKYGYCMVCIYVVQPRGTGWRMHDNASDRFTVWRRPHVELWAEV